MKRLTLLLLCCAWLSACDKSQEPAATDTSTDEAAVTSAPANPVPTGDTIGKETCTQAYSDLEALVKGLEEQLGESDSEMPDRLEFIANCESLPAEVQECMVFEFAMANQDECKARVDKLDPEARKTAQELMGK